MEKLKYNKNTLDIIKSLSSLSKSLIFEKNSEGDKILINSGDISAMIVYQLEAPLDHFSFLGDSCAFYEYPDFHDLMTIIDKCDIYQNSDVLNLVSGNTKIKYLTSDPELIETRFEGIDLGEIAASFILSFDDLKKINKLKSSIKANSIKIDIIKNKLKFTFFNKNSENTCEDVFNNNIDNLDEYSFIFTTEIFDKIPLANYSFDISEEGIIMLKMLSDDINLRIYTGEMEEDV